MNTLLHVCCAPCANQPIEVLRTDGFEVTAFWYNPNIHPFTEYRSRRNCLRDYAAAIDLPLIEKNDYALRPFVRKFVTPVKTATNADMAIGRSAYLTETVDNLRGTGALKLDGKEWTVRSMDQTVLPAGTLVKIVKLEGVKLYVTPVQTAAAL